MNFRLILKVIGRIIAAEAVAMLVPLAVALLNSEPAAPFLATAAIMLATGGLLSRIPAEQSFFERDGFVSVGLIWIVTGVMGALPFAFCGYFPSFIDCVFESISGFTTTGATILTDIESMPRSILFWRSFTHWLGGMGVLVLATAILPGMGIRSHYLTQAETPGPVFSKLVPKQSQTSKILYSIYLALTLLEVVCLKIAGMPLFDAFIHAFSSAGTGGFSSRNASVGAYDSAAIDIIITVFILLFSLNFALYFLLFTGKIREILGSDELRFFLAVVLGATALITLDIRPLYDSYSQSLRYAAFQVATIISTTGFITADYALWPQFAQFILVLLMFCGACAGSTGGGMKCSRVLLLLRSIRREVHRIIHPNSVEVVKLDGKLVKDGVVHSVLVFVGCYLSVVLAVALIVSLEGCSFATAFSSALTCVSNVGPGLELVGPTGNFAFYNGFSKIVLSAGMLIGRLEIFPILILFSRSTWRRA